MTSKFYAYLIYGIISITLSFNCSAAQQMSVNQYQSPDHFLLDAHVHVGLKLVQDKVQFSDSDFFTERGLAGFIFAMPVDRSRTNDLHARIKDEVRQVVELAKQQVGLNFYESTIPEPGNTRLNEIGLMLSIEYFYGVFDNDLSVVQTFKELGIRFITFADNANDGLFETNGALSPFGNKLINEMNRTGLAIDVSHLSEKQLVAVATHSKVPVIASHSAAYNIGGENGCLTDEALLALKENMGYFMLTFNESDLFGDRLMNGPGIDQLLSHLEHIKQFVGIQRMGIGSDYQAAGKYIPQDMNNTEVFENIKREMAARGYSQTDINGILGLNMLHFLNSH